MSGGVPLHGLAHSEDVERDDIRPLVQGLEEGVLAVGARIAEDDAGRGLRNGPAVAPHTLAVGLHLQLLEEGRQEPQPAGVRNHRARGPAEEVTVQDVGQGKDHGQVLLRGRPEEVRVHLRRAPQQALEDLGAQGDGAG